MNGRVPPHKAILTVRSIAPNGDVVEVQVNDHLSRDEIARFHLLTGGRMIACSGFDAELQSVMSNEERPQSASKRAALTIRRLLEASV